MLGMRFTDIDQRIAALAANQYGAFNRQQAFEIGASERFVQRRLGAGDWIRIVPSVYVLSGSAGTWRRQCKIAELSVPGSALAGRAAAALHGMTGFKPGPIELVVPATAYCRHPIATLHRYSGAPVTEVAGIRTTTIAQTAFDLAMVKVSPWTLERALDDCLSSKQLSVDALQNRADFYVGSRRPGLNQILPLIDERRAEGWVPPESELEALLCSVLERLPSRPRFIRQAPLPWRSSKPGRVDVLLPDDRLIMEADGRRWHARVADFDRDRWRDNEAVAHGHRVQRFTWVHLNDFVDDTIDLIERTLANAAA